MTIMQGDAYPIEFAVNFDGEAITPNNCTNLEFSIGQLSKQYLDGELTFSGDTWKCPLTQQETFSLLGEYPLQCRVKIEDEWVKGKKVGTLNVIKSQSRTVI